jgi:DNA replication factor GINS
MQGISFDELKKARSAELRTRELSELPEDFYQKVGYFISDLKRELKHSNGLRAELLKKELEQVIQFTHDLYLCRLSKCLRGIEVGNMPVELMEREKDAFNEIKNVLERLREGMLTPAITGKVMVEAPKRATNYIIILLQSVPTIIGENLKTYGPFEKGEVASIPRSSAELLIKQGVARGIEMTR